MALDNITIPIEIIMKHNISISEYIVLYDVANGHIISGLIDNPMPSLISLEKKGYVRFSEEKIFLRDKSSVFFAVNEDLFLKWLKIYPTTVSRKYGGKRALSPANPDTILGNKLHKKWKTVFKKDVRAQEKAIGVLERQISADTKSGDMEYFVEASRWLNEGYHEKYSYLLDESQATRKYDNEDYM